MNWSPTVLQCTEMKVPLIAFNFLCPRIDVVVSFLLTVNTFSLCIIFFSNHQKRPFPYSRVLKKTETDTPAPVLCEWSQTPNGILSSINPLKCKSFQACKSSFSCSSISQELCEHATNLQQLIHSERG